MKIRTGFVSNSSSSSFAIFGIQSTASELAKLLIENKVIPVEEGIDIEDAADELDSYEVKEVIEEKGLACYDDDYNLYVGLDFMSLGDDETKNQFKARIGVKLKEIFGKDFPVEHHAGEYPC